MEINRINFSVPRRYAGELESLLFWAGFSFVRIKRKAWIHRGACSSLPFEFDVCTGKLLLPHLVGRCEGGFSPAQSGVKPANPSVPPPGKEFPELTKLEAPYGLAAVG